MKKILFISSAFIILFLLFTHPVLTASGCSLGLTLWYRAVLPSLLPFFIFSNILMKTGLFHFLNQLYAPLLQKIFRISQEGCYAIFVGFLCGFPMGAKITADLVKEQQISKEEGAYLLGFCNNVSPAFFLNYICTSKLSLEKIPWKLFFLFYSLPLLYGFFSRPFFHFPTVTKNAKKQASLHRLTFPMLDTCIMDSFSNITRLGGYIILFTIFVQFLTILPISEFTLAICSACLEISCGIDRLSSLSTLSPAWKLILIYMTAMLGGSCIFAQSQSVLSESRLSIKTWVIGRIILALLLGLLLVLLLPFLLH